MSVPVLTLLPNSWHKPREPEDVSANKTSREIDLINSPVVSECLLSPPLLLDRQVQKATCSTFMIHSVGTLASCRDHPEYEWFKVTVTALSIDCRILFKYTFYRRVAETLPDILLLRVRALYSNGEFYTIALKRDTD